MKYLKNITSIKTTTLSAAILGAGVVALVLGLGAATASAQLTSAARGLRVNAGANVRASSTMRMNMGSTTRMSSTTRMEMMQQRQNAVVGKLTNTGSTEITARISALNALSTRLSAMKNLSSVEKSTLSGEITTLIGQLTTLQTKIEMDASSTQIGTAGAVASTSPLRQDFTSITKAYRVYALIIPQTEILAAADRVDTIVTSLTTVSAKLQARLSATSSPSSASVSLQASLSDLNAKVADAQTQASAAVSAVSSLVPDNGDTTVAASNEAALKSGRSNIATAQKDIQAADKDAHTILAALEHSNQ